VVIRPVVVVPVWEVYYHSHRHYSSAAMLQVIIGPFSGDLYIDGQYYGEARSLDDGRLELPVSPGLHTVQLRHGGRNYTHKVHAKPGVTAVVKAKRT
jgi:hypothetical protein